MKEHLFIIGDNKYTVKDENELALIFELLSGDTEVSPVLHWNVIMELDNNLTEIIVSYKGLISCLKILNEKNSFLLLLKIGNLLDEIVNNSEELGEILARIPDEESKIRTLKQIRSARLKQLVLDSKDLSNILEWIYDDSELDAMKIIGYSHIKRLFSYPKKIYNVLNYLNNENKNELIEIIGIKNIINITKTWQDLLFIIKGFPLKKAEDFLKHFTRLEIKNLFTNDNDFKYFISKLSERKEKLFLNYLGISYE